MMTDFINWEVMLNKSATPREAGSHIGQLTNMFANSHVIACSSEASWSGCEALVFLFAPPDPAFAPKIVLITDYFGSCSGCDAWEGASDQHLRELLTAIANNARTFDSFEEIDHFLGEIIKKQEDTDGEYGEFYDIQKHAEILRKQLREVKF